MQANSSGLTLWLVLSGWLILNVWMTRLLLEVPKARMPARGYLLVLLWILPPVFNALFVLPHLRQAAREGSQAPRNWDGCLLDADAPQSLSLADARTLDWPAALHVVDGIPLLSAEAAARAAASSEAMRGWLLHLRDALGPAYALYRVGSLHVLTTLDAGRVFRLTQRCAEVAPRVRTTLGVLGVRSANGAWVLWLDEDELEDRLAANLDAHLRRLMRVMPGMVGWACSVHEADAAVAWLVNRTALACLDFERLPMWLAEGVAQRAERELAPIRSGERRDRIFDEHWDVEAIHDFWSGESFARLDGLYGSARTLAGDLVAALGRDGPRFLSFVAGASKEDAGASAAIAHLGIELGVLVAGLLGQEFSPAWAPRNSALV